MYNKPRPLIKCPMFDAYLLNHENKYLSNKNLKAVMGSGFLGRYMRGFQNVKFGNLFIINSFSGKYGGNNHAGKGKVGNRGIGPFF
jgi:hypothetical protein